MAKRLIFAQTTPLGHRVSLWRDRWREIIRFKHPRLRDREADVRECLGDPDLIRESVKDPEVHLYYKSVQDELLCVVVMGKEPKSRWGNHCIFHQEHQEGQ